MKTSSCKNKGRRLQQWIVKRISEAINISYGKDQDIESRPMGLSGSDVILHGKAKDLFLFDVEAKNCENWSFPKWIKQAKSNQTKGMSWLLIVKKNHHEPIAVMDAEVFFKIHAELIKLKEEFKSRKK